MGSLEFHLMCLMIAHSVAGPVGPLPPALPTNATSLVTANGGCIVGDVLYTMEEEFPGASPCERCRCDDDGVVRCSRVKCEPRPGCKAIHRPDHCCPTYQCDCEQGGRVYGNGEKLVDATEPCRVCYCQGGEVVCRKVACFLRDDCKPRLVPGRCCPEYDNCPIRGETAAVAVVDSVKQEITIKEITPISEIPIIGGVQIEEVQPTAEDLLYPSSKSPLIVREVTPLNPESLVTTNNDADDIHIPFSTENSPSPTVTTAAAKTPMMDEEDPSFFDHNPAFPPIPDDLSVLSDRGDEIVAEPSDEHLPSQSTVAQQPVTEGSQLKNSPMLNLRAAIPTEILDTPSSVVEDINGEEDEAEVAPATTVSEQEAEDVEMTKADTVDDKVAETTTVSSGAKTRSSDDKSNVVTEVTVPSELSFISVDSKVSTHQTTAPEVLSTELVLLTTDTSHEIATATTTRPVPSTETATDRIVTTTPRKNNVLADLINLVGDVASISEHTEGPAEDNGVRAEIEGEDEATVKDAPPPNDRVEPTTKRPIIDDVTDDKNIGNKTVTKEIDIIAQSYVPAINRRPTKVLMTTAAPAAG